MRLLAVLPIKHTFRITDGFYAATAVTIEFSEYKVYYSLPI